MKLDTHSINIYNTIYAHINRKIRDRLTNYEYEWNVENGIPYEEKVYRGKRNRYYVAYVLQDISKNMGNYILYSSYISSAFTNSFTHNGVENEYILYDEDIHVVKPRTKRRMIIFREIKRITSSKKYSRYPFEEVENRYTSKKTWKRVLIINFTTGLPLNHRKMSLYVKNLSILGNRLRKYIHIQFTNKLGESRDLKKLILNNIPRSVYIEMPYETLYNYIHGLRYVNKVINHL